MLKQNRYYSSEPTTSALKETGLLISPLKEQFLDLSEQREYLLEQINLQRSEWEELMELIQKSVTEIQTKIQPCLKKIVFLEDEIHLLFARILKRKKLGKRKRNKVMWVYGYLLYKKWISMSPDNEYWQNFFERVQQKPAKVEMRSDLNDSESNQVNRTLNTKVLRHTFVRLAEIFHPDRVSSSDKKKQHTEIMQELNRAYQDKDIARLIEIERQFESGQPIAVNLSERDNLKVQCEKLRTENELLTEQLELLKKELILMENSYEGNLALSYREASEDGFDPASEILSSANNEILLLTKIRDFVRLFHDKKITIQEFANGPSETFITEEETIDLSS